MRHTWRANTWAAVVALTSFISFAQAQSATGSTQAAQGPSGVAARVVSSSATGYLSLAPSGEAATRHFFCTVSLVDGTAFAQALPTGNDTSRLILAAHGVMGLTAGHCLNGEFNANAENQQTNDLYATFDGGLTSIPVTWQVIGHTEVGLDVGVVMPLDGYSWPKLTPYKLSTRKMVNVAEDLYTWGWPYGSQLTYSREYVANNDSPRVFEAAQKINWQHFVVLHGSLAPGQSGSPVFDASGEIVGLMIGVRRDGNGWYQDYMVPIAWLFRTIPQ